MLRKVLCLYFPKSVYRFLFSNRTNKRIKLSLSPRRKHENGTDALFIIIIIVFFKKKKDMYCFRSGLMVILNISESLPAIYLLLKENGCNIGFKL